MGNIQYNYFRPHKAVAAAAIAGHLVNNYPDKEPLQFLCCIGIETPVAFPPTDKRSNVLIAAKALLEIITVIWSKATSYSII